MSSLSINSHQSGNEKSPGRQDRNQDKNEQQRQAGNLKVSAPQVHSRFVTPGALAVLLVQRS
jgi:hypothetical protein